MADRDAIVAYADDVLEAGEFRDALPAGLQLPGAPDVRLVVSGVTASLELFARAAEAGAQMVLVHHGLFWDWEPRRVGPREKARLAALIANDLSLVAYHLPLDAHPEIGNNALLLDRLGLAPERRFARHGGRDVGFIGAFPEPVTLEALVARVRDEVNPAPLVFSHGPERIRRVAVVSGSAANDLPEAADAGADCFLTGEPKESAMAHAREARIHFIAAGHYATETFGVRALGDRIAERFGVAHRFVDIPNPV